MDLEIIILTEETYVFIKTQALRITREWTQGEVELSEIGGSLQYSMTSV